VVFEKPEKDQQLTLTYRCASLRCASPFRALNIPSVGAAIRLFISSRPGNGFQCSSGRNWNTMWFPISRLSAVQQTEARLWRS